MALPMLVGGSECGPSNPLQSLSKRFEQDRGAQQDFFGAARAGSSRDAFRSQRGGGAAADQDAARFFSATNGPPGQFASEAHFDVSALRQALPLTQAPIQAHGPPMQQQQPEPSAWAMDFMQHTAANTSQTQAASTLQSIQGQAHAVPAHAQPSILQQGPVSWSGMPAFRAGAIPTFIPQMQVQPPPAVTNKRISWDQEFSALDLNAAPATEMLAEVMQEPIAAPQKQFDGDELARTAGRLLDHVQHEQNPKFQKSQFLGLMKQLRDGEVIVEGNKVVESDGTRTSSSVNQVDLKGKGRAVDPVGLTHTLRPSFGLNAGQTMQQPQENAEFAKYWNEVDNPRFGQVDTPETTSWNRLQEDWERFEATTTGVKAVDLYRFQENNPYLLGESSRTRHHLAHAGPQQAVLESVLELEAAVQRDMTNAVLWYELGVRQQENEREHKALQALKRAVELDPTLLSAWLALAISYTNDSNRQGTYDAITEWVNRNTKYSNPVNAFQASRPAQANMATHEQFSRLIDCLIAMARSDMTGEVDADIQIALAVLLNTNEEYDKAQDCFRTALAVRPDDWLLYNRVGATMANSGRAEEALQYYYKALELNPAYIRARFNLGISCINLRRYEEAVQHILDALLLQDSDATAESDGKGVVSTALWDSLKTSCLHLQRADLATLCDIKDLDGFRKRFYG